MSSKKISLLPLYSGDPTGTYLVMNNAGETGSFKVLRETIIGASGSAGTSGTSGSAGTSGLSGSAGTSGTSGSAGTSGTSGASGSAGTSGSSGTSGVNGSSGTSGSNGTSGSTGTSGSAGTSGTSGLLSLTGTTNNGVITLNGSAPNATVESNLTFDGSVLGVTGSINVSGPVTVGGELLVGATSASGDEGGEIKLQKAPNSTLSGGTTIDAYVDKIRIFEQGGSARGVFIDLSKAPTGVGGELSIKASGLVNAGVDVTLGNLKARIPTSGARSLQVSTVSGTYSVTGSNTYSSGGTIAGSTIQNNSPRTINTTPAYLNASYNFTTDGSTDTWIIYDAANVISWRITCIIGPSYVGNMISIERLL